MEPIIHYELEKLTNDNVNIIIITSIELNNTIYEIKRSRICYSNSPTGRNLVVEKLPQQYQEAIFAIWGEEPTVKNPKINFNE